MMEVLAWDTSSPPRTKREVGTLADAEVFVDLASAHIAIQEMPPVLLQLGMRYDVKPYVAPRNRIASAFFPPVSL
jgi:hypothetical protein